MWIVSGGTPACGVEHAHPSIRQCGEVARTCYGAAAIPLTRIQGLIKLHSLLRLRNLKGYHSMNSTLQLCIDNHTASRCMLLSWARAPYKVSFVLTARSSPTPSDLRMHELCCTSPVGFRDTRSRGSEVEDEHRQRSEYTKQHAHETHQSTL